MDLHLHQALLEHLRFGSAHWSHKVICKGQIGDRSGEGDARGDRSCRDCGETLYNTNGMDWRVVSQWFIRRNLGGKLPEPLQPLSHFYYDRRVLDIDDDLPKRP